jgi:hypothetical protein
MLTGPRHGEVNREPKDPWIPRRPYVVERTGTGPRAERGFVKGWHSSSWSWAP